jgi:hypothetical protein
MSSSPEEPVTPTPRRSRLRRTFVVLLAVLGVLEVVYVGAGLFLVKSGQVERWINKNPGKLRITFDSVWPIVPGVVRVRGFRIVNQGRGDQLEGKVDRVWGAVNPFELLARRVHIVWLRCRGVEFRLRKRPKTAEEAASLPTGFPQIEGVPWEPYPGAPASPAATVKKKAGMTIVFTRSRLEEVRDVWIGERRILGDGTVVASVTVFGGGPIAIPFADVRFDRTRFENGAQETFTNVRMRVLGELARYDLKVTRGFGILSLIMARVDLDARMPSGAGYLNAYLRNAPWIRFTGGEADLSAHLSVDRGRLVPSGWIELSSSDRQAEFAGFTVRGKARTRLDVVPISRGADARLVVSFDKYDLHRGTVTPRPLMQGQGLRIVATTPASLTTIPPTEFSGRLELGRAVFPHLDFANKLLPVGGGLTVRGGSAKVEGAFDVEGSGSSCSGSMTVSTDGLALDTGSVGMKGAFKLVLTVPRGDLLKRTFDVDGMKITLDRFTFASQHETATASDWNASITFPKAHLEIGDAFAVRGTMKLHASDSRPVVAFLSKDKPLKGWKKKLVTVGMIEGGSRFSLSGGTLEVDDFSVGWEGTEVKARFRTTPQGPRGKAFVRVGILKAGISLEGKERDLHLVGPKSWFEKR